MDNCLHCVINAVFSVSHLVRSYLAVMKHYDQSTLRKGFIWLTLYHCSSGQELKQGRNLEAGANAEVMERCCLLTCPAWLAQPVF